MPSQSATLVPSLPDKFVYLEDIDPTILQEARYAMHHNFMGRPVASYNLPRIIVTEPVALALKAVQQELRPQDLTLKVYDGYRPQDAVDDFGRWAEGPDESMKEEFYPNLAKLDLFKGYIAKKSCHTRGGAVDLTLVPLPAPEQPIWQPGDPVLDGRLPQGERFLDNSLDMGTSFDCLDELSHTENPSLPPLVQANRQLLKTIMEKHGFENYWREWWHFGLINEPFPDTYFNFPVE